MAEMEPNSPLDDHDRNRLCVYNLLKNDKPTKLCGASPKSPFGLWVFWSRDGDAHNYSQSLPTCSVSDNPIFNSEVREKIKTALCNFSPISSFSDEYLVQFWAPTTIGGRCFLTTTDQPFGLGLYSVIHFDKKLYSYRLHSVDHKISVDAEDKELLGPVGRVFCQKSLESSPDVRYYSSQEYPLRHHALSCNLHGYLALPVFEPSGPSCVGVLELISTQTDFCTDGLKLVQFIKALEKVDLKTLDIFYNFQLQAWNRGFQDALEEISKAVEVLCRTHKLPLAQTWVPCMSASALACSGYMENSYTSFDLCWMDFMEQFMFGSFEGTSNAVPIMSKFNRICDGHPLLKGKGVVGRAFLSSKSFFCSDITQCSITEYPLVHYAREMGLTHCFATCLQSSHTENYVYVLEIFLPTTKTDDKDTRTLLNSLFVTMKQEFRTFKFASGEALGEEVSVEVIDFSNVVKLDSFQICQSSRSPSCFQLLLNEAEASFDELMMEVDATNNGMNVVSAEQNIFVSVQSEKESTRTASETERIISFDDLKQYFGMTLKDASEALRVSRSTLKRICRKYDIHEWPFRKRKKVIVSLPRVNHLNVSVQGAEEQISESSSRDPPETFLT